MTSKESLDSLVVKAVGKNIDSLDICLEIWSESKQIYTESWKSVYYFQYDGPYQDLKEDFKRQRILNNLNKIFSEEAFSVFDYPQLEKWPYESDDELYESFEIINWYSNYYYYYDSLKVSGESGEQLEVEARKYAHKEDRPRPETLSLWNSLSKIKPMTFTFFSGGEYMRTIVWDYERRMFVIIWECC